MNGTEHILYDSLSELRAASLSVQSNLTEGSWRLLMDKYNMLFLGGSANTIYANDLRHSLKTHWNIELDIADVLLAIPTVCASLGMNCRALIEFSNAGKPNPPIGEYSIELF